MGKVLLILLFGLSASGLAMVAQSFSTERAAEEDQIVEHAGMLAREIANSAYAIGVDRARGSFHERPLAGDVAFENVQFGEGFYDLYILELASGVLRVTATGRLQVPIRDVAAGLDHTERTHTIQGDFVSLNEPPAALVVDADLPVFSFGGSDWLVSGSDARATSRSADPDTPDAGRGSDTPAAHVTTADAATLSSLAASIAAVGAGHATGVTTGPPGPWVDDVYADAVAMATEARTPGSQVIASGTTFTPGDHAVFGSPTLPVALHVLGDVVLQGSATGYGVLVVEGDLTVRNGATWEGLVVVVGSDDVEVRLTDEGRIIGSLVTHVHSGDPLDPARLDVRIDDDAQIRSSAEAVGLLATHLPTLHATTHVESLAERHSPATAAPAVEDSPDPTPPPPPPDENECGCRAGKVGVMHYPRNGNNHIICIAPAAVRAHTVSPHHWAWNGEADYVVCNAQ